MKKRLFSVLPLLCLMCVCALYGHTVEVRLAGIVLDGQTGTNLRGVNVTVENSFYGTISNESGNFRISMSAASLPMTLSFDRAGYMRAQIQVTSPEQDLKVALKPLGAVEKEAEQASAAVTEYKVKINLIRLFAEKVEWADAASRAGQPFVVAVIGYNPFGEDLFAFEKIRVKGREVKVVFLGEVSEITNQDMLIVSKPGRKMQEELQQQLAGKSILTICDNCDNKDVKATFTLETVDGKVRFRLNDTAATVAGLTVGADIRKAATQ